MVTGQQQQGLFPISAVSNLTGVNPVTLRAWERRYGLIKPHRTESGHRLYSDEDVERIKLILQLIDEGIAISRVKEALRITKEDQHADAEDSSHWNTYQENMLRGVNNFDEGLLDAVYNEAMSLYPVDVVTKQLLLPLLEKLGQRWMHVSTGVAEEHFFSVFMRNKLGARFHHQNQKNQGPRLIAACLPNEQHEFGLMLFSLTAHARGYRIVLLGADMPIEQLAEVVHRSNSDGVVLSGSIDTDPVQLQAQIKKLVKDTNVPVWIGGKTSEKLKDEIQAAGAHSLGHDLIVGMHKIHK
ncbi:MAG: MerR family transcriptional regulator, partial [Thioalkalispiraceae bacterium]